MRKLGKGIVLVLGFVLLIWLHNQKRNFRQANWKEYGKQILGIDGLAAERNKNADRLRVFAAVLVVFVHSMQSAAAQISLMLTEPELLDKERAYLQRIWYVLTGAAGLGLCCNLLFILISGGLLLPYREEKTGVFYSKRISKVLIPLAAYYFFYLRRSGLLVFSFSSIVNGLNLVISGPMELVPHFWLIYVLTGLYIGVPFFRWMLKELPETLLEGMAAVILIGSAAKTILYFFGVGLSFASFLFSWEGIFLLGYFCIQPCSRKYRKIILAGGGICGAILVFFFCSENHLTKIAVNDSFFMIVFSLAVYSLFMGKGEEGKMKKEEKREYSSVQMMVQAGSRYSYSILLIHWFMLFVVIEKHLHIGPFVFGTSWILAGVAVQSVLAVLFSLIFALFYDQSIVFLAEWMWRKIFPVSHGISYKN